MRFSARRTSQTGAIGPNAGGVCDWRSPRALLALAAAGTLATLSLPSGASPGAEAHDAPAGVFYQLPVHEPLVGIASVAEMARQFLLVGYALDGVRYGQGEVPRLLLANLPGDLTEVKTVEARKALFIQAVLPLILRANEEVAADRERLLGLIGRQGRWNEAETGWVALLAARYATDPNDLDELSRRVDVIPTSLAIAQAAEESGWGTSRFAISGNAVFGQWTYDPDKGLVPVSRNAGAQHLVRTYDGLLGSVLGYMLNLNTHDAYNAFRNRRHQMRTEIGALDAGLLANTLLYYSEGRRDYVKRIHDIIDINDLTAFDDARLSPGLRAPAAVNPRGL